jgi:ribonuclease BN (tRNA processing enzyme)
MTREHLTPEEIGKLAARAHVKAVILNHIVALKFTDEDLLAGVKRYYSGPVFVGRDMMRYTLP